MKKALDTYGALFVSLGMKINKKRNKNMATGTVKWFNPKKGYGFIAPEEGDKDIFVHITAVQAAGMNKLDEGQKLSYDAEEKDGKVSAVNLQAAE